MTLTMVGFVYWLQQGMAHHDDDFQIVSHRKAARRKSSKKLKVWQDQQNSSDDVHVNEESIVAKLQVCR